MPDMVESTRPAVLLHGFDCFDTCRGIAGSLLAAGFPVLAAGPVGDAGADLACDGFTVICAEKGAALRAGLEYFSRKLEDLPGVVTLDACGGYCVEDVRNAAEALQASPAKLVAASRADDPALGLFPRIERLLAWLAFTLVHGRSVKDPWSGLKALPAPLVPAFLDIKGEGRKYEFNIVLNLQHKGIKAVNVPVGVKYALAAGSGFWDRAADIFRVLILPFKFISASLVATLLDNAVYLLMTRFVAPGHWVIALTACRSAGAISGYVLNRNLVFRLQNNTLRKELASVLQFALLAAVNYGLSVLLVGLFHTVFHIYDFVAKLMSDGLLFITSYTIQREFIFRRPQSVGKK